jgi:pimeloyl-ACP methyl ester carboxylesterase
MTRPVREENGFFEIAGLRLEYQRLTPEPSAGPTLVFLHEGLGCVALWKEFPRRVAETTGCPVLSYSRAGYGRSSPAPLPRPLSFMHDEGLSILPQLLDQAQLQQAVLVGHSDGASIALIHAGGVGDPRLRGLILLAPHVFVEELTLASIRQAARAFRETGLRARLARYHGENVDGAFHGWCDAWLDADFRRWNLEAYLPKIALPVLLIQGEQDNFGTGRQLEAIHRQLPRQPELILLPDCGHSPFRDQATKTLQAIAAFLDQTRTGRPASGAGTSPSLVMPSQ